MPAAYTTDLRERVIKAHLEEKMKIVNISRLFNLSRNTIGNWLQLYRQTDSVKPRKALRKGFPPKVQDLERFKKIIDAEPGITLARLAATYGGISPSTATRTLRRLGYTRKKNLYMQETK